jgi:hypothetical protein
LSWSEARVHVKELYFTVSLLGPYYTIVGRDRTLISLQENHHVHVTNFLTVSPENEYAGSFESLSSQIRTRFANYRFVPFHVLNQPLEWLHLLYTGQKPIRLYQAIFNDQLDLSANREGNEHYMYDSWIKEGYQGDDGQWMIFPPTN